MRNIENQRLVHAIDELTAQLERLNNNLERLIYGEADVEVSQELGTIPSVSTAEIAQNVRQFFDKLPTMQQAFQNSKRFLSL